MRKPIKLNCFAIRIIKSTVRARCWKVNQKLKTCKLCHLFVIAGAREMKGTDCRLNIIKMASVMHSNQDTHLGRDIYRLLMSLIELQKIAYAEENERSPRIVLRAYNQSFVFALLYLKLFSSPKKSKERAMFGMPFHAISHHLPDIIRLVNGRSIGAKAAERHFNKLRYKHSQ